MFAVDAICDLRRAHETCGGAQRAAQAVLAGDVSAGLPDRSPGRDPEGRRASRLLKKAHLLRSRTGYPSERWVTAPCIWTLLSSLGKDEFFSNLLEAIKRRLTGLPHVP